MTTNTLKFIVILFLSKNLLASNKSQQNTTKKIHIDINVSNEESTEKITKRKKHRVPPSSRNYFYQFDFSEHETKRPDTQNHRKKEKKEKQDESKRVCRECCIPCTIASCSSATGAAIGAGVASGSCVIL